MQGYKQDYKFKYLARIKTKLQIDSAAIVDQSNDSYQFSFFDN